MLNLVVRKITIEPQRVFNLFVNIISKFYYLRIPEYDLILDLLSNLIL